MPRHATPHGERVCLKTCSSSRLGVNLAGRGVEGRAFVRACVRVQHVNDWHNNGNTVGYYLHALAFLRADRFLSPALFSREPPRDDPQVFRVADGQSSRSSIRIDGR